ncbi:MAG: lysophospholipid acyltransferase family protein [Thermonemataceae bacterium]|nr:lysophospholipid acyltransferase family protein [Thermonemataceae bacterium]
MYFLRKLYAIWIVANFIVGFLIVFPFLVLFFYLRLPSLNTYLYKMWSWSFFKLIFIPVKTIGANHFSRKKNYVFCANHFSYLDIALMAGLMKGEFVFVGKSEVAKIPLFGYMFAKMHISIKRGSKTSAAKVYEQMKNALVAGKSIIIFPEGGIFSKNPPQMVNFKDGAFKVAADTQTPIIPVSICNAWRVLPDDSKLLPQWHKIQLIVSAPLLEDSRHIAKLKQETFEAIQTQLT